MWQIKNIENGDIYECDVEPKWISGIWECGQFRITDADQTLYTVIAPEPVTPADIRRAEIEAELAEIDAASARPLRAILTATTSGGTADATDVAKLAELEAQARALRTELASLGA